MRYLFLSGEPSFSTGLVYKTLNWDAIHSPVNLVSASNVVSSSNLSFFRRSNRHRESFAGCIHYCDVSDKNIEENNLNFIINNNIPCWPNPQALLRMVNRHIVIKEVFNNNLLNHNIFQIFGPEKLFDYPFVLKVGTDHRGIGKYLIKSRQDWPDFKDLATVEPYFEGKSVRVLIIGDDIFGIETVNNSSWIKNSPGGDMIEYKLNDELIEHAIKVSKLFDLDVAGVDYIVNDDGFHFLEINQYPGLYGFDNIVKAANSFFMKKMSEIEEICKSRII